MEECGTGPVIGGEGNGGVIDPRVGWVRRSVHRHGALILNLMAETKKSLSQLTDELPVYTIIKDKYEVDRSKLRSFFGP